MLSTKNLALAVALAAGTSVTVTNAAVAQHGGYYSYSHGSRGYSAAPVRMAPSYTGYRSRGYGGYPAHNESYMDRASGGFGVG